MADIPIPEASGRHLPVPHYVLAETVVGRAERLGLALQKESWGLARDGLSLYGACVFICDNGVMIGEIEVVKHRHASGLDLDARARDSTVTKDRLRPSRHDGGPDMRCGEGRGPRTPGR